MAFSSYVSDRALVRAGDRCESCGRYWHEIDHAINDSPIDSHSASSFHVVRNKKTGLYRATSVPPGHEIMQGRILPPHAFIIQKMGREDDAFCLCQECHQLVHRLANMLSAGKKTSGNTKNAIPHILEWVTLWFVLGNVEWTL
jgi:hypothetical protein